MAGPLERRDPAELRISDDDRHHVAELLRRAAGEGRLEIEELDERLEATYAAKTYADLAPITSDLPAASPRPAAPAPVRQGGVVPAAATHDSSFAVMSECRRQGAWLVPERHTAVAMMGGVKLDLREATFTSPETVIRAHAIMGGIDIVVDAGTHVIVEGVGFMGSFGQSRDRVAAQITADSPVVRVRGFALMAGVTVVRRAAPGTTEPPAPGGGSW